MPRPKRQMTEDEQAMALEIGARIRALREAKDLTQAKVAAMCGVSANAMSQWETGRSRPERDNLLKLASKLETTFAYLLQGDGHAEVERAVTPSALKIYDLTQQLPPEDHIAIISIMETLLKHAKN